MKNLRCWFLYKELQVLKKINMFACNIFKDSIVYGSKFMNVLNDRISYVCKHLEMYTIGYQYEGNDKLVNSYDVFNWGFIEDLTFESIYYADTFEDMMYKLSCISFELDMIQYEQKLVQYDKNVENGLVFTVPTSGIYEIRGTVYGNNEWSDFY